MKPSLGGCSPTKASCEPIQNQIISSPSFIPNALQLYPILTENIGFDA
ncbi:MAG: hypothetical protein WD077_12510 [Bacteroidia bacterium]